MFSSFLSLLLASCYFLLVLTGVRKELSGNSLKLDANVDWAFWCSPSWVVGEGGSWMGVKCLILISRFWKQASPFSSPLRGEKREEEWWISRRENIVLKWSLRVSLHRTDLWTHLEAPNKSHVLLHQKPSLGDVITVIHHTNGQSTGKSPPENLLCN